MGLLINPKETKKVRINSRQMETIRMRETEIEDVEELTYLGSEVSTSGGTSEDRKHSKSSLC